MINYYFFYRKVIVFMYKIQIYNINKLYEISKWQVIKSESVIR